MKRSLTPRQIWTMPIILGCMSAAGLLAALLFDGVGELVSWLALAVPIMVIVFYVI